MAGIKGTVAQPTPSELRILRVLWKLGSATVADVVSAFPAGKQPNYKTTHTFLRIMEAKRYVRHSVSGKSFVFEPLVREDEVASASVESVLTQTFGGSVTGLMLNLLEAGKVRPGELEEIEALISAYRKSKESE